MCDVLPGSKPSSYAPPYFVEFCVDASSMRFRISFAYFSLVKLATSCENDNHFITVTPLELQHSQFKRDTLNQVFECMQLRRSLIIQLLPPRSNNPHAI